MNILVLFLVLVVTYQLSECQSKSIKLEFDIYTYNIIDDQDLVRYRNQPDKTTHQLRTTMHHYFYNQVKTLNLSIIHRSGPVNITCVESN